jgi:antitoxin HigA-1
VDYHYEVRMPKKLKPVHPGEILHEGFMAPLGLSMNKMAMDLSVPVTRIADIVNELRTRRSRFARYFKNTPTFWDESRDAHDLKSCRRQDRREG